MYSGIGTVPNSCGWHQVVGVILWGTSAVCKAAKQAHMGVYVFSRLQYLKSFDSNLQTSSTAEYQTTVYAILGGASPYHLLGLYPWQRKSGAGGPSKQAS